MVGGHGMWLTVKNGYDRGRAEFHVAVHAFDPAVLIKVWRREAGERTRGERH